LNKNKITRSLHKLMVVYIYQLHTQNKLWQCVLHFVSEVFLKRFVNFLFTLL